MARRFLVSTTHHLLAIEPESETLWQIHSGAGLYFGLAHSPDGLIYAACRKSILGPDNDQARASEEGTILVLDRSFRVCEELRAPFPLRDMHGMAVFDGRLWVTCSYDNLVAIYDLRSKEWQRWYPAPNPTHRDHDIHHFNTIRFFGGQLCLLAHNFGPSELLCYDYPSLQLDSATPLGSMAHDLFTFDGTIATCSSGDGWIVNRMGQRLRTAGFPRGIETTPDGNLLGVSVHSPRDQRQQQSGILRWYTRDWHFQADYLLPRVGMVLDIIEIVGEDWRWDSLEVWPCAEVSRGKYNQLAPGNVYLPKSFAYNTGDTRLEWHVSEETHRWTAARDAGVSILMNPGETGLWIEVGSANPNPYSVEVRLDQQHLGTVCFSAPATQHHEFCISPETVRAGLLRFRVPFLWKPSELIPGSDDERLVGVAVHRIGIR